jgi:PilY1 beta-propeller domain
MTANSTKAFVIGLAGAVSLMASAAPRFDPSSQPLGSIAPLVLSNTNLSDGGVTAYRPWFENGAWQGDIIQYDVSTGGSLTTTLEFSGTSPAQDGTTPANWSALVQFAAAEAPDPLTSTYYTQRKIITSNNGVQKPFLWDMTGGTTGNISTANLQAIDQAAFDANANSSIILNWLRGDRSNEYPAVAALRKRTSVLGDIIHSNPVYVGNPRSSLTENGYATWARDTLRADRGHRVYVGANDGMLHAFDAATGNEVWAYIPSMVIPKLSDLTSRPYEHTYFVDGKLTVADAYFTHGGVTGWRTVLVGALGAGGRGIFALDITNADMANQSATSGTDIKFLWEKSTATNDPNNPTDDDLGDSFSRPVIAKLNDGDWYTIVGNGYNSVNGEAMLYLINMNTKAIKKLGTGSGTAGSPNGLSTPRLLDANRDGMMDFAYAGDIDGNLWKFNLSAISPASWAKAYRLHIGAANQAITSAPEVTRQPDGSFLLVFATGRLFEGPDSLDQTVQAMYGLKDPGTEPAWITGGTAQNLVSQPFKPITSSTGAAVSPYAAHNAADASVAVYSPDAGSVTTQDGWKVAFPAGYRVLEGIQIRGGRAKVTMTLPRESGLNTAGSGLNWLTEGSVLDGGPNPTPIFDLNLDGVLNASDLTDGNGNLNLLDSEDVPMGWQRPDGIMSQVTIARVANGVDTLFLNFLVPPVDEPCTIDCGGFQGGHIDVDTWLDTETFGGGSTQHDHEYDKSVDRVFVDYFDINVPVPAGEGDPRKDITGQVEIDSTGTPAPSSGIAATEPFVVLVANADFSRGSEMQLGNKTRNVVEYQIEIHKALQRWDASDPNDALVDSEGDSLVFTWGGIKAAGGTIKHSFNDVAILAGGLHPTQTGCVKEDAYGKDLNTYDPSTRKGRWRNGALTTQLVKASHFSSSSAINDVTVQDPNDLTLTVQVGSDNRQIKLWNDVNNNNVVDASDPNEVRYSGLIASSGTEHIWESTLFWHFGKLNDIVYGGKPCYGEADWARAAALETSANPFATALEQANIVDLDQEILDNVSCSNDKDAETGCADYFKFLLKLKELQDDYSAPGTPGSGNSGGDGETAIINMGGGTPDQGSTSGPDFDFGRLGVTDVVPN